MRLIYWLRVTIFSAEAIIMALGPFSLTYFSSEIGEIIAALKLNEEMGKTIMLLPLGLSIWILNELRLLLTEDKEVTKLLLGWPDYWRLKTHFQSSLFFAILFVCMSLLPWITEIGIKTERGFVLFLTSLIGQLALSLSVYNARIRLKEILASC